MADAFGEEVAGCWAIETLVAVAVAATDDSNIMPSGIPRSNLPILRLPPIS